MTENVEHTLVPAPKRKMSLLRWLLWAVALWVVLGAVGAGMRWSEIGSMWQAPKLSVPVVVIESDDWGGGNILDGDKTNIANRDTTEAAAADRLVRLLKRHHDSTGRSPVLSAFVIVGQADIPAIVGDPKGRYHWKPIDQAMPKLVVALRRAEDEGVFTLEYHARDHRDGGLFALKIKRAVEECAAEGKEFDPAIVATFSPEDNRERLKITAEYFDSRFGYLLPLDKQEINRKVEEGLHEFKRMFGKRPMRTVAPCYLWGPRAEAAWRAHGLRFVHGVNCQYGPAVENDDTWLRKLGFRTKAGMVGVPRNVNFDHKSRDRSLPPVDRALREAIRAMEGGQPAVISTHSWNYCDEDSQIAEDMLKRLDGLLSGLEREYPNLRYLSAEEVGVLADSGRTASFAGKAGPEIITAKGWRHAWAFLCDIYYTRLKATLWVWGLWAMLLGIVSVIVVRAVRGRLRDRTGKVPR